MSFDLQLQKVTHGRHVDESQLPHLLHVGLGEVLDAGDSQATLGANEALGRREGVKSGTGLKRAESNGRMMSYRATGPHQFVCPLICSGSQV